MFSQHLPWIERATTKELHFFERTPVTFLDLHNQTISGDAVRELLFLYQTGWRKHPRSQNESTDCPKGLGHVRCERLALPTDRTKEWLEVTPVYIANRRVPWVLSEVLPHASEIKFVLLIRNPIARTLSGFFQSSKRSNMTAFESTTRQEISLLRRCYAHAFAITRSSFSTNVLQHMASPNTHSKHSTHDNGSKGTGLYQPHSGDIQCRTGNQQYDALQECLGSMNKRDVGVDDAPWFRFFTHPSSIRARPEKPAMEYQGHVYRGMYVDQLANYLCAGFEPEQFIVLAASELFHDPEHVLETVAHRMGRELHLSPSALEHIHSGIKIGARSQGHTMSSQLRRQLHALFEPYSFRLIHLLDAFGFQYNRTAMLSELGIFGAPRGGDDDDDDDDGGGGEAS